MELNKSNKLNSTDISSTENGRNNMPDLINQKGNSELSMLSLLEILIVWIVYSNLIYFILDTNDKARKYLEGIDGVKFNEIQVPDTLKKQLEFFDRDVS